ncbi:MAG TPA: DUF3261 domain-containing protein [Telluria sp.]|jgi:hypothetical protein
MKRKLIAGLATALVLGGCASTTTEPLARMGLKLAPSGLGESISLQQHLTVERNGRIDELDAALEIDPERVEMVGLAFGQRVLSINYDGKELTSWRHLMLPKQVRADDVLEDMQLTLWPVASIAASLPEGWRIEEAGPLRRLYLKDELVATITYSAQPRWSGTITMDNLRYKYKLTIQSAQ